MDPNFARKLVESFGIVWLRIQVSLDVTPCRWGSIYRNFEGSCCLHLQGLAVQEEIFYYRPKLQEILNDRHSVTSHKTPIFNSTAVRSSNPATRQFMTVPTTASHLSLSFLHLLQYLLLRRDLLTRCCSAMYRPRGVVASLRHLLGGTEVPRRVAVAIGPSTVEEYDVTEHDTAGSPLLIAVPCRTQQILTSALKKVAFILVESYELG